MADERRRGITWVDDGCEDGKVSANGNYECIRRKIDWTNVQMGKKVEDTQQSNIKSNGSTIYAMRVNAK